MSKNIILLSILVSLLSTIACNSKKEEPTNNLKCSDTGEIFSLIINEVQENGYKDRNNTQQLAISDSTHSIPNSHISFSIDSSDTFFIKKRLSNLESVTLNNFWDSNKIKISLANEIQLHKDQVFSSQVKSYPRYLNLSNVGFNKNCTQALITYHYICGPKCGYQRFILLTEKENKWAIEETVQTAVH